ncbi:exported hypothetical protein [Candidatus Sulfopaludibacter sp. SbA3]|nr:exported hypothetical protein [Candidatus Sulfopaludibacter sp. SbA3]
MSKLLLTISAACLMLAATCCQKLQPAAPASATIDASKYYGVLLTNGSVYFGHIEGLGSPFPVLKEVYYIQSSQNPETKEVKNILVKRGKEWHGPDRMIINEKSIVFVEPVGIDSTVAKLIEESKR